jgi:exodeoxyribonuclease VII large subunit
LFEQFLKLKARLESQGLFEAARKRPLPPMPRGIGVVTSLGAAALRDVVTALQRRVPHIPVWIAPASVQGEQAAGELVRALESLFDLAQGKEMQGQAVPVDVILLVRGGGAMEDLWAFNDEQLAHTIASSPVPVISGVGHETDFTIADFVADLRAPTPTAAAELVSAPTESYLRQLSDVQSLLRRGMTHYLDREAQQVDHLSARFGRPSGAVAQHRARLMASQQSLRHALQTSLQRRRNALELQQPRLPRVLDQRMQGLRERLARADLRLQSVDPSQVLQRGYAWLTGEDGRPITSVEQARVGQALTASLADGTVDLQIQSTRHN